MDSVRRYKHSSAGAGGGKTSLVMIQPKPSVVGHRALGEFQQYSTMNMHGSFDDEDEMSKFDRLPSLEFNPDWMEGPEEQIKVENPFESYMLSPAVIHLGKDQKKDLKTVFDLFDDGSGLMNAGDVEVALQALDLHFSKGTLLKMLKEVEPARTGFLCFGEFVRFFEMEICKKESREDITGSFQFFDREGKGKISVENLREVGLSIGVYMDEVEAQDMISGADRDGDGKVNFDEFRKVIQRTTIIPPRPKNKF